MATKKERRSPELQNSIRNMTLVKRDIQKYGIYTIPKIAIAYDRSVQLSQSGQYKVTAFVDSLDRMGLDSSIPLEVGYRAFRMTNGDLNSTFRYYLERAKTSEKSQIETILAEQFDKETKDSLAPQTSKQYLKQYESELAQGEH